eukprot:COSAG02_NODE_5701_length_4110_cov_2.049115_4_plen_85_part_00
MQSVPRSISYDPELEILVINPIVELVRCKPWQPNELMQMLIYTDALFRAGSIVGQAASAARTHCCRTYASRSERYVLVQNFVQL